MISATHVVIVIVAFLTFIGRAEAQRTYTFEDACRMAGKSSGACAPQKQQQREQSPVCQRRDQAFGFHGDQPSNNSSATIADWMDVEVFVELMGGGGSAEEVNRLGLVICREPGQRGGFAYIERTTNYRILAFDPAWAKASRPEGYLIIAHEAGHHFCKHNLSDGSNREQELEADRFTGASIKRFEIYHGKRFLESFLDAANRLFDEGGRRGRPSRDERIVAIRQGYDVGSACGNLPPAVRGPGLYTR